MKHKVILGQFYLTAAIKWIVFAVFQHVAAAIKLSIYLSGIFTVDFAFKTTKLQLFHPLKDQRDFKKLLKT